MRTTLAYWQNEYIFGKKKQLYLLPAVCFTWNITASTHINFWVEMFLSLANCHERWNCQCNIYWKFPVNQLWFNEPASLLKYEYSAIIGIRTTDCSWPASLWSLLLFDFAMTKISVLLSASTRWHRKYSEACHIFTETAVHRSTTHASHPKLFCKIECNLLVVILYDALLLCSSYLRDLCCQAEGTLKKFDRQIYS